jgi:hypothetical protein
MPSFFRYDGSVRNPNGNAIPGADVAVLTQPASFAGQPGSPLATIYAANASNAAAINAASWQGGQLTLTFTTTPPADVVPGAYIALSGVTPSTFNSTLSAPYLVVEVNGNNVIVVSLTNPGTYVSGGTIATSVLPNPTTTDTNGNFDFYSAPGIYSLQIYGPTIEERDLIDQGVGTVAGGSVTSVGFTAPAIFTVTGSPIPGSGTIAVGLANENANLVLAGPATGAAAAPTFRALVAADLPGGFGTVSSVGVSLAAPPIFTVSVAGSPVTSSGTIAITIALATETANTVWAGPASGSAGTPTFRGLVVADIPASGYASLGSALFAGPLQELVTTLSGSTDAIVFPGANYITTAGIDATTLATPTAGGPGVGNDGDLVTIVDTGGHAHTVTTASNKIVPAHHLITFGGTAGSFVTLQAFGGLWYPLANVGVTIS